LLNGAQVPSPDPTRRVVPLDLFPTEVLQGIVVQKTYSADMPGEFGGGTIQLRTRGVPESFLLRASATVGHADGTTGEQGLRYDGGRRDWLGRDDGSRYVGSVFGTDRLPTDPAALQQAGRDLAGLGYAVREDSLLPGGGVGFGVGDDFAFRDGDIRLGYIAALRYAHAWDDRSEQRNTYSIFQDRLIPAEDFVRRSTTRSIDSSLFLALGLRVGEHHSVNLTATRLRQSEDDTQIDEGLTSSGNIDRITQLEWVENSLDTIQLAGEHSFPEWNDLYVQWQATDAAAGRYSPNTREFRFTFDDFLEDFIFESFNQQRFDDLEDDATDYSLDLRMPLEFHESLDLTVQAGASQLDRDRVSSIRRFRFSGRRPQGPIFNYEDLLQPGNIGPTGLRLEEGTLASDNYTASQRLDAYYLMLDLGWRDWRANLGVRQEDMLQTVTTVRPFDPNATPEIGVLDSSDRLPAASLTWAYSEKAQLRLAYSTTLSRPDIREQTRANFVDPLLDVRVEGNPNLQQAEIENIDLRWEYYFNSLESVSVALFSKRFTNPIELVSVPASGSLLQIAMPTARPMSASSSMSMSRWRTSVSPAGIPAGLPAPVALEGRLLRRQLRAHRFRDRPRRQPGHPDQCAASLAGPVQVRGQCLAVLPASGRPDRSDLALQHLRRAHLACRRQRPARRLRAALRPARLHPVAEAALGRLEEQAAPAQPARSGSEFHPGR
jgi:hypothetical protein